MGSSGLIRIDPYKLPTEKAEWLWEKVKTQTYALDDFVRNDARPFFHILFAPGTEHYYNEFGMVSVLNIVSNANANIHFMVWDRGVAKKLVVRCGQEIITHLFEEYNLNRVTATIPKINLGAIRLCVLLGMKFEGTMRESFLHNGQYLDAHMYGLLRREWEGGRHGQPNPTEHESSLVTSAG